MKLKNKKTGEVFDVLIREKVGAGSYSLIVCDIKSYEQSKSTLNATHFVLDEYETLAELNADWEDYEPKEPLIKNEKIRKAVRAWWEAVPDVITDKRVFYKNNQDLAIGVYTIYCGAIYPETLEVGKMYTIEELCGDEE